MARRKQALWALADQMLSSASNFLLLIVVIRSSSATEAGAFGLAYATFFLLLMLGRAVSGDPMNVRHVSLGADAWRCSASRALGVSLCASLVLAVCLAAVAWATAGPLSASLAVLAAGLPGLLLQDTLRLCHFAAGDARSACMNDTWFLGIQIGLFAGLLTWASPSPVALLLAWGAAGTAAGSIGLVRSRLMPNVRSTRAWLGEHRDLIVPFAADYMTNRGAEQGASVATSTFGGLAALGAVTSARTIFAPATTVQTGLNAYLLPEIARLRIEGRAREVRSRMWALVWVSSALMLCTGAAAALVPPSVGDAVLGENWRHADAVLLEMTVFSTANAMAFSAWLTMRGLGEAVAVFRLRAVFGVQFVLGTALGAHVAGAEGAIWGMSVTTMGLAVATLFMAERTLRILEGRPVASEAHP